MKMRAQKIVLVHSDKLKNYDFGLGHPFRANRFKSFMKCFRRELNKSGIFEVIMNDEPASEEDLLLWHKKDYIQAIQNASVGKTVPNLRRFISGDNINHITGKFPRGIEAAARVVIRNGMLACETVQEGKYEKAISIGGGLHHARPKYGEGFCVYNDVVISAKHLIRKYGLDRILILDTDAHAGNGTCEAFYSSSKVLFIDIHQRNIYPGTGYVDEIGEGKGKGFTVNVPLLAYAGDEAYKYVFNEIVFPLAEEYDPQFIIRNGGSDPHPSDKITQLGLTLDGFRNIGANVRKIAKMCNGKEIDLICSGYNLTVLPRAWSALISGLAEVEIRFEEPFPLMIKKDQRLEDTKKTVQKVKRNLRPYWKCMRT